MFPPAAPAGFAVVDILVKFFAFDLPFELPFLATVLMIGRLAVLVAFGNTVVFDWAVEIASVLVVAVLLAVVVVTGLDVARDTVALVEIGWTIVENTVLVSPA